MEIKMANVKFGIPLWTSAIEWNIRARMVIIG